MKKTTILSAAALAAVFSAGSAFAGELNVVCSNEQDWCDLMADAYEDATGNSVAMVRKSTGETLAQVR
ncbi:MAG: iron ABC transporter substrate-binding protein, partial [Marinosulfonomonas sp.]|nr:iron ABC transporter substrate-binding protein [Marinosulfonomonas sp.]